MSVNDNQRLSYKIGKGYRSQWLATNKLAVLDDRSLKVYDTQAKQVLKQFTLRDSCDSDFSITKDMDIIIYKLIVASKAEKPVL